MPVAGGIAHKVEHRALTDHPHRPQQKQRPLAHEAKTHHVEAKNHQRHHNRPLRQIADDQHHFNAVYRRTEDKLPGNMTIKNRHQRQQHQRIDHKEDAVLHIVEGRDTQRYHPGKGDPQRLTKVIRRVNDITVRGKNASQRINRHSAAGSPDGSAGRQRCGQTDPRCYRAEPWHGRRSAAVCPAVHQARRGSASAGHRAPSG